MKNYVRQGVTWMKRAAMPVALVALMAAFGAIQYERGKADVELVCGEFTTAWEGENGCEVLPAYLPMLRISEPTRPDATSEDDPGWDCRIQANQVCGVLVRGQWYLMDFEAGTFGPRAQVRDMGVADLGDCAGDDNVCDVVIDGVLYGIDLDLMELVTF